MKITVLSLDLYGFNKLITNRLTEKGIDATYISSTDFKYKYKNFGERLINFLSKSLLNKNLKKEKQTKLLLENLDKTTGNQDYILVVDPAHFNHTILKEVRKKANKLIAYNYDSLAQLPLPEEKIKYFDEIYSFDKQDCKNHHFKFITNFIYLPKHEIKTAYPLKAFTIQSKSKDRIQTLSKIADKFDCLNIHNYYFLVYGTQQNNVNKNIVFFNERLCFDFFKEKMNESEILIDIVRDGQNGLSFRIFEAMALQKKLITTNKNIIDYDFYNPNNILVIDKDFDNIPSDFLNAKYQEIPENVYNKYTLDHWLKTIFGV